MDTLIYDIEVRRIPWDGKSYQMKKYEYASGWRDYEGLGIACICAWSYKFGGYGIFSNESFDPEFIKKLKLELDEPIITIASFSEFYAWIKAHKIIAGYNSREFDDKILAAANIPCQTNYDILREIYAAIGLNPHYTFPESEKDQWRKYTGYKLEDVAKANFGRGKIGSGATVPIQWQDGEYEAVIRYCLDDVRLERDLFFKAQAGELLAPNGGVLKMRKI